MKHALFAALVKRDTPIRDVLPLMGSLPVNKHMAGFAVVIDEKRHVLAALSDGDIRRGLAAGIDIAAPVEKIANFSPLTLKRSLAPSLMRRAVMDEARRRDKHFMKYDKLILTEEDGSFYDVIALKDILEPMLDEKTIAVYGLGFVGLTLACTLANAGLSVVGIDTDKEKLKLLESGAAPFYEKGLDSMLSSLAATNPIRYVAAPVREANIHIVSVGSPVGKDGKPDLSAIESVARTIAGILKNGDLVIFRSTVPVGTMRHVVLPLLEQGGLRCGNDFHLAFAPERTVEGNALEELRYLPQIVGGFNAESTSLTARLFRQITNVIVEVQSLEEAEMVKLMNNSFRDLVFSFATEAAYMCEAYNINAFRVIRAANEGYPRDRIPLPGPGVGGVCLSKDPLLYSQPVSGSYHPQLGRLSRDINSRGPDYVLEKLNRFASGTKRPLASLNILIVGLAFKGMPETSDIRDSVALKLIEKLPSRAHITVKDFVVPPKDIQSLGCKIAAGELQDALAGQDVVLFMNNHYRNNKFNVVEALRGMSHPVLFFDGWNMFDMREIERLPHVCYATMGYTRPGFAA